MSTPATGSVIKPVEELGPNMQLQDLRTQGKARVELVMSVENKYPDGVILNNEDAAIVKKYTEEALAIETRVGQIEDAQNRHKRLQDLNDVFNTPNRPRAGQQGGDAEERRLTPGDQFTKSNEFLSRLHGGGFNTPLNQHSFAVQLKDGTSLLDWKALLVGGSASGGGAFVPNDLRPGYVDLRQRELNILDLIPRLQTSSDMIEYVREDTYTNAAAFVAEATGDASTGTYGRKPESTLAYSLQTSPVRTLAHWLPVTNRMLADAPGIRGIINSRLLLGLTLVLEAQIISGDGTGENLTGVLNAGITTFAASTMNNVVDAILRARTMVRTGAKMVPNGVVMNPADFEDIRLLRENIASATLGQYLMGPPSVSGPMTVFGMPVVESENIAAGRLVVGAWDQGASIWDREQSAIRVGTVNDQFVRNIQTILAEQRLGFTVWRPAAFVSVSGV
jgi:HK97 family phage major capsid protein